MNVIHNKLVAFRFEAGESGSWRTRADLEVCPTQDGSR